jgi:hypothetical protein
MLSESIIAIAAYNQRQEENERSLEILQSQYYDLRDKCERTLSYKNSFEFTEISKREQDAIKMQYQAMHQYLECLSIRLEIHGIEITNYTF